MAGARFRTGIYWKRIYLDNKYMSGQLVLDNMQLEHFKRMAPHTGMMDLRKPFTMSGHAKQPEPILHTINHRLAYCEQNAIEK